MLLGRIRQLATASLVKEQETGTMSERMRYIVVALILLTLAVLACGAEDAVVETLAPVEEVQKEQAVPVEPTDLPPPGITVMPSATPMATDVPAPAFDVAAAQEYLAQMLDFGNKEIAAMTGMAGLTSTAAENNMLFFDPAWIKGMRGYAQDLISLYPWALDADPPELFAECHEHVTRAAYECAKSGETILQAMDALESGDIEAMTQLFGTATGHITDCGTEIGIATQLMNAIELE